MALNAKQHTWLVTLVAERVDYLRRAIAVEEHVKAEVPQVMTMLTEGEISAQLATAAKRVDAYRRELALAEPVLADLRKVERASS